MSGSLVVGEALKAAREAKGWTVQEAASKLRLMARQIEAMESEDYAALGQPVFARGFVRNYARLLDIDPEPLLTKMAESGAAPAEKVECKSHPVVPAKGVPPVLIGALVVMSLLLALPTLLYFWLNSGESEAQTETAAQSLRQGPAVPAIAPQTQAAPQPEAEVQPAGPGMAPSEKPASAAMPEPLSATASKQAALAEPSPAKPATPSAPGANAAALPDESANPYLPANYRHKSIRLQFDQDAWVSIRDGHGKTIHSNLNKAGSTVDLTGAPPFEFVVGNAAHVRMTYNGRPFDIKPYIGETVARFTLE